MRYVSPDETQAHPARHRIAADQKRTMNAAPSGSKSVRALERGLDVLLAVRASDGLSLNELHRQLALPKATLLRMLVTLSSRALVWRRIADHKWLAGVVGHTAHRGIDLAPGLAQIASPLLLELSHKVVWPSVLAVPRFDHMEIIETNSTVARFDFANLGPVGAKLSYLHTAIGRAYLAACPQATRDAIIARLQPPDADAADRALLDAIVAQTHARRWSTRLPHHPWADRNRQLVLRDGRSSIAVAIMAHELPIASLNMTWPSSRAQIDEVVDQHLPNLRAIAAQIGRAVVAAGFTR